MKYHQTNLETHNFQHLGDGFSSKYLPVLVKSTKNLEIFPSHLSLLHAGCWQVLLLSTPGIFEAETQITTLGNRYGEKMAFDLGFTWGFQLENAGNSVTSLKKPREERDSPGKMSIAPEKKVI
jgi:hypothetical protein